MSQTSLTYNLPSKDQSSERKDLRACENDAIAFARLALEKRFQRISLLLSEDATKSNFLTQLKSYARELRAGDLFLLTFSGHGGQIPDQSGDEEDGLDEVWCFFDEIVTDDELFEYWELFDEGVRIVVLSDSCHSGDILKGPEDKNKKPNSTKRIFQPSPTWRNERIDASIQVMAACRSGQLAREKFTGEVWHGAFTNCILKAQMTPEQMSYSELFNKTEKCVPGRQRPYREFMGKRNESFFHGPAFEIRSEHQL